MKIHVLLNISRFLRFPSLPLIVCSRFNGRISKGKFRTVSEEQKLKFQRKTGGRLRDRTEYQNEPIYSSHNQQELKTPTSELKYLKLEDGDRRFVKVVSSAKSRKYREEEELILLEGKRLINDALSSGVKLKSLYFTRKDLLNELQSLSQLEYKYQLYKIQYQSLKIWSDVKTPSGLLAVFKKPPPVAAPQSQFPLTIVCDNIRDPGNMGTIIRSAAAAGCQRILFSKGCVDVWEPKVLRSAAGAHFKIPLIDNLEWSTISAYIRQNSAVFLADITKNNDGDEINRDQLLAELENEENTYEIPDSGIDNDNEIRSENNEDDSSSETEFHKHLAISNKPYYAINYARNDSVTLVIGGETEGISSAAYKLVFDRFGEKVFIPMIKGIDSLNSAIACSVIAFEIKRQFQQLKDNEND
ncbi:rRNA methyltransferase 3, mitochondrial-like [Tubulanus polymorphus]|uniref:rRNA methyltransferase 3, mitochondrial-like n=1 Tax=Tubulanus polymorphus TaxID=672921 RepID=UPI003DA22CCC